MTDHTRRVAKCSDAAFFPHCQITISLQICFLVPPTALLTNDLLEAARLIRESDLPALEGYRHKIAGL
jgi:hypothetical protein